MPGGDAEAGVVGMRRSGEQRFKALSSGRFIVDIERQLGHALLGIAQRTPGAGDHIAQQRAGLILVLNRQQTRGIFRVGALRDYRHHIAADLLNVAHQIVRHIDDMRGQIAERAQPCQFFLTVPVQRRLRAGEVIFIMRAVKMHHFTNLAARNDLPRQLAGRIFHVIKTHQRFYTRPLCRLHHLLCIRHAQRQRLFRVDMFAVADRLQRHLFMQEVGRADIDNVDLRIADQLAPVAGGAGKAKRGRLLCRQCRIDFSQHLPHDLTFQGKHRGCLRIGDSVTPPDISAAGSFRF
ncbi:hypothetical protein COLO4_02565 [Corchorus olitorius]|uniref:Uncharacterized protein n=1 Tax=Corchorus olitorius TaxID=93759 RepID=A0A1R3L0X7_9ROSI|nr:hypothetical protein COLO4_02565 [Corchorus olitorius]